jgi:uncharacterized protein YyaL (SSP411 family)
MESTHQKDKTPNRLIHQSSPYLRQHAYNPVDWYPWEEEALHKAKKEDKPILVSIGYSSCHWCHVMERESFESEEVASIMNKGFVCIKVDREERPDIDQVYMDALQSMNVRGGWPLNVFLTSDAKPFYGGTYFPPSHWINLLNQITKAYSVHRSELEKSAEAFTNALNHSEVLKYNLSSIESQFTKEELEQIFTGLESKFDNRWGGKQPAPKFPMPSIYLFLLRYYSISKNEAALKHIKLTLDKMAMGGLYDQAGGGFARYSTDDEWFAPHFEKMLYDNGQLLSLYSEAYAVTKSELYKQVVYETVDFLQREMMSKEGGFYSALDADTEGIEGRFYVFTEAELDQLAIPDRELFNDYYGINPEGNWEHSFNILYRRLSDVAFANKHKLSIEDLLSKVKSWKSILLEARNRRIKPGVDDKILTSWNGLMLRGLVDAYRIFDEESFLQLALKNVRFIQQKLTSSSILYHSFKDQKATIDGFLEDYAFVIHGYISLYQATFEEEWLYEAKKLCDHVIKEFWDPQEGLFYFTSHSGEKLIARKKELFDNVIPASNSAMAINLHVLGHYFDSENYSAIAAKMIGRVKKMILVEPSYLSNWAVLFSNLIQPTAEIAITGSNAIAIRKELDKEYLPNVIFAGTMTKSKLPLLEGRDSIDSKTRIFVCYNKTCQLPIETALQALHQLSN